MGGGDRQCSEVLRISNALAFSTASRVKLAGACLRGKGIDSAPSFE